jgi:hypothetical protein
VLEGICSVRDTQSVLNLINYILAATAKTESGDILDKHRIKHTPLTKDELTELLRTDYSSAYKKFLENKIMFRGVNDSTKNLVGQYGLLKPGFRISQYARYNLYTRLFSDILPSWKGYPPRNRSFICSTSTSYAAQFASSESGGPPTMANVYAVLPKNGAVIGVCPDVDLWWSFKTLVKKGLGLEDFQHLLLGVIEFIGMQLDEVTSAKMGVKSTEFSKIWLDLDKAAKYESAASIVAVFNTLSEKLKIYIDDVLKETKRKYPIKNVYSFETYTANIAEEMLEEMKRRGTTDILEILDDIFNPKTNGIKKVTIEQYGERSHITTKTDTKHSGKEVWTDSECLFINKRHLKLLKQIDL